MSPLREFTSVTLEIVAFFFVTLDLYGKERVEALTELLKSRTDKGLPRIRRAFYYLRETQEGSSPSAIWAEGLIALVVFIIGGTFFYMVVFAQFALWLLERVKFSGVLLIIGPCLFVIAKGLIWLHLLGELRAG